MVVCLQMMFAPAGAALITDNWAPLILQTASEKLLPPTVRFLVMQENNAAPSKVISLPLYVNVAKLLNLVTCFKESHLKINLTKLKTFIFISICQYYLFSLFYHLENHCNYRKKQLWRLVCFNIKQEFKGTVLRFLSIPLLFQQDIKSEQLQDDTE